MNSAKCFLNILMHIHILKNQTDGNFPAMYIKEFSFWSLIFFASIHSFFSITASFPLEVCYKLRHCDTFWREREEGEKNLNKEKSVFQFFFRFVQRWFNILAQIFVSILWSGASDIMSDGNFRVKGLISFDRLALFLHFILCEYFKIWHFTWWW